MVAACSAGLGVMEGDGFVAGREGARAGGFWWFLVVDGQVVGLTWGMPPDLQATVGKTGVFVDQQISLQEGSITRLDAPHWAAPGCMSAKCPSSFRFGAPRHTRRVAGNCTSRVMGRAARFPLLWPLSQGRSRTRGPIPLNPFFQCLHFGPRLRECSRRANWFSCCSIDGFSFYVQDGPFCPNRPRTH